jgi:ferric-dicitrate binding protein FerR (iron transport regulator)
VRRKRESDRFEMEAEAERLIEQLKSNWCASTLAKVDEFERRSPEHAQCLDECIWRRRSWHAERAMKPPQARPRRPGGAQSRTGRWVSLAAGLAVATGLTVLALRSNGDARSVERVAPTQALAVALADGSDLLLYAGARAIERVKLSHREIALLEGGLSVRDANDDGLHPLSIITPDAEVVSNGMHVNIIRRHRGTDVCVTEGVAQVFGRAGSTQLRAGDAVRVVAGGGFQSLEVAAQVRGTPLTRFRDTSLRDVAAAFNRMNCSIQFEVAPEVVHYRINASVDLARPEIWTVILERDPMLRVNPRPGLIRIAAR